MGSNPNHLSHFILREYTVYAIEPLNEVSIPHGMAKTWLVKVEESKPGEVRVTDPISGFHLKNLSEKLPKSLNLFDCRIKEITKAYGLGLHAISHNGKSHDMKFDGTNPVFTQKVVVSTCFDEIDDTFSLMALLAGGILVVWRRGHKKYIDFSDNGLYFKDIVYHNNKFYALANKGLTITVDSRSLKVAKAVAPLPALDGVSKYLVNSFNDLYLIDKKYLDRGCSENLNAEDCLVRLNVFKLDEEKHEWVQVQGGLEDKVLFVGDDYSFSLSAKEFSGCKGNCVYFSDYELSTTAEKGYPGSEAGIFDLEDDTIGPLSAFPGYSEIFWPPPSWLKQNSSLTC